MNPLVTFYNNEPEREAVHDFLIAQLKEYTVELAFAGKDVSGIKEAAATIEKAFNELEVQYGTIKPKLEQNSR